MHRNTTCSTVPTPTTEHMPIEIITLILEYYFFSVINYSTKDLEDKPLSPLSIYIVLRHFIVDLIITTQISKIVRNILLTSTMLTPLLQKLTFALRYEYNIWMVNVNYSLSDLVTDLYLKKSLKHILGLSNIECLSDMIDFLCTTNIGPVLENSDGRHIFDPRITNIATKNKWDYTNNLTILGIYISNKTIEYQNKIETAENYLRWISEPEKLLYREIHVYIHNNQSCFSKYYYYNDIKWLIKKNRKMINYGGLKVDYEIDEDYEKTLKKKCRDNNFICLQQRK